MDKFSKKMFFRLWWPGTLGALAYTIGDISDALILGADMGVNGLAAISFCVPIYMLYNVIMFSFGLGGASRFSVLLAEGKTTEARKCFNDVLKIGVGIGVLIAVFSCFLIEPLISLMSGTASGTELFKDTRDYALILLLSAPVFIGHYILEYYLGNDNMQNTANLGSTVCSIANIPLTIWFVFSLELGTAGAALSTALSHVFAILCYLPALWHSESNLCLTDWKLDFKTTLNDFASGFSVNVTYVYQLLFLLIMNNVLMRYFSPAAVAIFDITQNISYLFMFLWEGNSKALQPLISMYVGECFRNGIESVKKLAIASNIGISTFAALLFIFFPEAVCSFFGFDDVEMMDEACCAVRYYAVSAVLAAYYVCSRDFYQAVGKESTTLLMSSLRGGFALLNCAMFSCLFWQDNVWRFYPAAEIVAIIIYCVWFWGLSRDDLIHYYFDESRVFSQTIENRTEDMAAIADRIEDFCTEKGVSMKKIYQVRLAVEELCVAILQNGFTGKEKGYINLTVVAGTEGDTSVYIRDTAEKYNPFAVETNKINKSDDFNMDAIGIMMLKKKAKQFFYRNYQGFNSLIIKF